MKALSNAQWLALLTWTFPYKCKGIIQLIGLKGSNRKYKRDDKMRALMPSDKSVPFLLASVAMEETETAYRGKYINGNSGDKRKRNEE